MNKALKLPNGIRYRTEDVQVWGFHKIEREDKAAYYELELHFTDDSSISPLLMEFPEEERNLGLMFVATIDEAFGLRTSELDEFKRGQKQKEENKTIDEGW